MGIIDWPQEEAEVSGSSGAGNPDHLWEESWDDDDTNEDFSKQLKYVEALSIYGQFSRTICPMFVL